MVLSLLISGILSRPVPDHILQKRFDWKLLTLPLVGSTLFKLPHKTRNLAMISGGTRAFNEYPFFTHSQSFMVSSGGVMISRNIMLTTAHSSQQLEYSCGLEKLMVGWIDNKRVIQYCNDLDHKQDAVVYKVVKIVNHPLFKVDESYDISIWILKQIRGNIHNDQQYPMLDTELDHQDGELLKAIGFGSLSFNGPSSRKLMQVDLPVISNNQAQAELMKIGSGIELNDLMICTESFKDGKTKSILFGDSGGPLFKQQNGLTTLVGLSSFGYHPDLKLPNVFTRVAPFQDWIYKTLDQIKKYRR